jgi:hypothetical protein
VLDALKDATETYTRFLNRYKDLPSKNDAMKGAMTDIAFEMAKRVWQDLPVDGKGSCFFCIGGVNAINPFAPQAVKNEIAVYVDVMPEDTTLVPAKEGEFYDMGGNAIPAIDLSLYDEIYMDFNGSMAFFNEEWKKRLSDLAVVGKVGVS